MELTPLEFSELAWDPPVKAMQLQSVEADEEVGLVEAYLKQLPYHFRNMKSVICSAVAFLLILGCSSDRSSRGDLSLDFLPTNGWPRGLPVVVFALENRTTKSIRIEKWYTYGLELAPNVVVYARPTGSKEDYAQFYDYTSIHNHEPSISTLTLKPGQRVLTSMELIVHDQPLEIEAFAVLRGDNRLRTPIRKFHLFPGPDPDLSK